MMFSSTYLFIYDKYNIKHLHNNDIMCVYPTISLKISHLLLCTQMYTGNIKKCPYKMIHETYKNR